MSIKGRNSMKKGEMLLKELTGSLDRTSTISHSILTTLSNRDRSKNSSPSKSKQEATEYRM
jgi:hypothetical protein